MSTEDESVKGADEVTSTETKSRRGRPRPLEVIQRDEAVLKILGDGTPQTAGQIALALGGGTKPSLAYLSLWRLRREGKVEHVPTGEGTDRFTWRLKQG